MTIQVKVTSGSQEFNNLLLRQFPSGIPKWGACEFHINSNINECDWWIVCHNSALTSVQTAYCDPFHTVFASMEPYDLCAQRFYDQFAQIISCDRSLRHRSIIRKNILTWWAGIQVDAKNVHSFKATSAYNYDAFLRLRPGSKLDRISVITSNKKNFPGHLKRLKFIHALRNSDLASKIDFWGGGHNPIPDKMDGIYPYKYHIVLENASIPDYWTEKLADSFLGLSYPFYYGCPNIKSYFPEGSLQEINISKPESAISLIKSHFYNYTYENSLAGILKAQSLVLNEYNIFATLSSICDVKSKIKKQISLCPPSHFPNLDRLPTMPVDILLHKLISKVNASWR